MSQVIDERVVEMKFDNKEFEKNIGQSIDSLDRLKQALNVEDTSKSIEKISTSLEKINTINFDAINNAASAITKKFSFVGTIVDQLRRNLVNLFTARGVLSNLKNFALDSILGGGERRAQNLAKAKFSLSAIVGEGKELDAVMASVGDSVDGTAYSLDEAAGVAANLVTIGYRGGEELTNMLRGVAGTASMAGANFRDIGNIFSKVAAKGHLMGDQINQLAYRNINVVELLAKKYGKTGDEITKMVSKGQISFSMFAETMQEAFGEHAAKANETYSGSLANLRSAFARIGADVAATKFTALKDVFNALRPLVNTLRKELQPTINLINKTMLGLSKWGTSILNNGLWYKILKDVGESIYNVFFSLIMIFAEVKSAFAEVFPEVSLNGLYKVIKFIKELTESLILSEKGASNVRAAFKGFFVVLKATSRIFSIIGKSAKPLTDIFLTLVNAAWMLAGALGDGIVSIADTLENTDMLANGFKYLANIVKTVMGAVISIFVSGFGVVNEAIAKVSEFFQKGSDQSISFVDKLVAAFKNAGGGVEGFLAVLKMLYHEIQNIFVDHPMILNVLEMIRKAFVTTTSVIQNSVGTIILVLHELASGKGLIIAFSIAIIMLVRRLDKLSDGLTTTVKQINSALGAFQQTLFSAKGLLDAYKQSLATDNFLKVAVGIAVIAVSLGALTIAIDDVNVWKFAVITGLLGAFVVAVLLVSKQQTKISGAIASIIALAGAVALIAGIFKMFETVDFGGTKRVIKEIGLLVGMMTFLSGIAYLLRRLNVKFASGSLTIVALASSLVLIASSLMILNGMDIEYLDEKLAALGLLIAAMVGITMYVKEIPMWKAGSLILVAIGMSIAAGAIAKIINGIKLDELATAEIKIGKLEWEFLVIGGILTLVTVALTKLTPLVAGVAGMIIAVGASFFLISYALRKLPTYLSDFLNGIGTLAVMVTGLAALLITFQKIGTFTPEKSKGLLGMAAAILAIGAAVFTIAVTAALLSVVKPETLTMPIITIIAIAASLALIVEQAKSIEGAGAAKAINAITGAIIAISALLAIFAVVYGLALQVPFIGVALTGAIATIVGILLLIGWLIREVSKLKGANVMDIVILATLFAGIMGVILELGIIAGVVKDIGALKVAGAAIGAITAILVFSLIPLMKTLNSFTKKKFNANIFAQMIVLFGGLAGVILAIVPLASQNPGQIFAAGVVVSAFTGVLGVVLYNLLDLLDSFTHKKFNWNAFAQMSVLILGIEGAILAMSKLASINGAQVAMAGVVVIGFTGVMSLCLGSLLSLFNGFTKKKFNLNVFLQMSAMIAGLVLIINQTALLARENPASILAAGAVVTAFSGVMTGLLLLFEKIAKNQNAMISGAGAMLMMSAGIALIAVSVGKMAGYDWDSLGESLSGLGLIIIALGAIVIIVSAISKDVMAVAGMLAAGGALLIACSGLALLAASLSLLAQYNFASIKASCDGLISVLITLGVILGILTAVAVATEGIGAIAILAVAGAISALGVSCGFAAIGIGVAALGISKLVDALQQLIDYITNNAQSIADGIVTISGGIVQALDNIGDAFIRNAAKVAQGITQIKAAVAGLGFDFVGGYYNTLQQAVPLLFGAGGALAAAALNGIQTTQDSHSDAKRTIALATDLYGGYLHTLEKVPGLGLLFKAGANMVESVSDGIRSKDPEIGTNAEIVVDMVKEKFSGQEGSFLDIAENWMLNLQNGIAVGGDGAVSEAWSIGQRIKNALMGGASGEWGTDTWSYGDSNSAIMKVAKSNIKDTNAADQMLKANDKKRKTWVKEQVKNSPFSFLADSIDEVTDALGEAGEAGKEAAGGLGAAGSAAKKSGQDAKHALKGWQELETTLSDTIDSQMDIFSEFDKKTELTGEKLLANMRSQVEGVAEWAYNMQQLSARGVNSALLQELSQLGPQGYEKVNAFMQMTDEQLAEANKLYEQRLAMPDAAAEAVVAGFAQAGMWATEGFCNAIDYLKVKQEAGMGIANAAILGVNEGLDIHSPSGVMEEKGEASVEGFDKGLRNSFWITRITLAGKYMGQAALEGLMQVLNPNATDISGTSEAAIGSFIKGIVDTTGNLTDTATSLCQAFLQVFIKELPEEKFFEFGYMIFTKFSEGLTKSNDELIKKLGPAMKKLELSIEKTFTKIGEFAAKGMAKGIEKNIKAITKSTLKATSAAEEAAKGKKGLQERSPSKKFFKIGEYVTLGLANGILSASGEAVASMQNVSSEIVTKFQNAVDKVQTMADLDDNALTLTPVLDLSMVEDGLNNASVLFNKRTISLGASVDNARIAAATFDRMRNPAEMAKTEPQTVNNYTTFNQTNTSPKALSNSEVYRQTNNLISKFRNR